MRGRENRFMCDDMIWILKKSVIRMVMDPPKILLFIICNDAGTSRPKVGKKNSQKFSFNKELIK